MTLGQRIHMLRTAPGLSRGQLAERLSVSRQAISKRELDASTPDLDCLVPLGHLFGIFLDQLVSGTLPDGPAPQEPDIRQLAIEVRRHRRTMILTVVGSLAVMPGCTAFAFLYGLRSAALSTVHALLCSRGQVCVCAIFLPSPAPAVRRSLLGRCGRSAGPFAETEAALTPQ